VSFEEELAGALPEDVPQRASVIEKASKHLELISAANEHMNLTRIATPKEAAIKHVVDCLLPWRHFAEARSVLDAGTGAGFPGIPLAIALPHVHFTLAESTHKKARFVEMAVEALGLTNVEVAPERAESVALLNKPELITARAVAPLDRLVETFGKCLDRGIPLLLYKGPDIERECNSLDGNRIEARVLERYELPGGFGTRTFMAVYRNQARARNA
jgi:16S rRNA (guanine527-N7)-methyltransferase